MFVLNIGRIDSMTDRERLVYLLETDPKAISLLIDYLKEQGNEKLARQLIDLQPD